MATDSFKFWDSYMHALDRVDDATAGWLVKALCHKVFDGIEPETADPVLGMVLDVMYGQASRSAEMAALGRKGGQVSGKSRSKTRASAASKRVSSAGGNASNEKKGEESSRHENSSPAPNPTTAPGGVLAPPPAPDGPPLP